MVSRSISLSPKEDLFLSLLRQMFTVYSAAIVVTMSGLTITILMFSSPKLNWCLPQFLETERMSVHVVGSPVAQL